MPKKQKVARTSAGLDALSEMVPVWDRAVLGTIASDSLTKVLHMISAGCHGKLGLEDHRPMPWGEMLLAVLAAAARDGLTTLDVLTESAVIASDLVAESDAVLARMADDGCPLAAQ